MEKNSYLVFSDDFGEHPSSCQHIFKNFQKNDIVVWVNTIGMRSPKLTISDLRKIIIKLKKMFLGERNTVKVGDVAETKSIFVIQPPMLPYSNIPGVKYINKLLVHYFVTKKLNKLHMKSPIVVTTAPNACDYVGDFNAQKIVYYCVDDFAEWPGLNKSLVQQMEKELIAKSDVFIATSQKLFIRLSKTGKETHLLTHGVDYEFFNNEVCAEHCLLKKIPKPIVGYFGLFDQRSNQELLQKLAKRMPDVSFVITGNVVTDVNKLKKIKNIFFTGSIPYPSLPEMVYGWDICMLPYKINKLTDSIQPLKIKEYMVSGKPVISTPMKEVIKLSDYIIIADTVDDWEQKIRKNLSGEILEIANERSQFLEMESWVFKAKQFKSICTK